MKYDSENDFICLMSFGKIKCLNVFSIVSPKKTRKIGQITLEPFAEYNKRGNKIGAQSII